MGYKRFQITDKKKFETNHSSGTNGVTRNMCSNDPNLRSLRSLTLGNGVHPKFLNKKYYRLVVFLSRLKLKVDWNFGKSKFMIYDIRKVA